VTNEDVYSAAKIFLKALDAAPMGTGAILKDDASKDRLETLVLRAISKLYAASYHCSNVARLVQSAHEEAKALASALKHPTNTDFQTAARSIGAVEILQGARGTFPVQEIAFEIDAFLAASRASIDFGGRVVGLHLGMDEKTSIRSVLKSIKKAPKSLFAFLLGWGTWIEVLRNYRNECVHYRALQTHTGYEAVSRNGVLALAILPFVIPEEIGHDQPDTRASRSGMGRPDDHLVEGLERRESWGSISIDGGPHRVTDFSISYSPWVGYVPVEDFCAQHLEKLREFLVKIFEETPKARFKFQNLREQR
jgi:hypothetical protein